jgi:hypothetical protein
VAACRVQAGDIRAEDHSRPSSSVWPTRRSAACHSQDDPGNLPQARRATIPALRWLGRSAPDVEPEERLSYKTLAKFPTRHSWRASEHSPGHKFPRLSMAPKFGSRSDVLQDCFTGSALTLAQHNLLEIPCHCVPFAMSTPKRSDCARIEWLGADPAWAQPCGRFKRSRVPKALVGEGGSAVQRSS